MSFSTASLKIMKLRLHYERRTWPQKYKKIHDLCDSITQDLERSGNGLQAFLSNTPLERLEQFTTRIYTLLRRDLAELHRLLGYEVRYSQCVAAECLIRTADNPNLLRRSISILQDHLQATHQRVSVVLERLADMKQSLARDTSSRFTEAAEECQMIHVYILTEATALDMVVQLFRGNAAGESPNCSGPLAAVPVVRREMRERASLQRAALQAISQISDRKVRRIIRTWLNILSVNADLRNDTSRAIDDVGLRPIAGMKRARDEQTDIALALQYLDRQEQLEANRARGLSLTAEDDQVNAELLDKMDDSGIADVYGEEFTEEEQGRLKRRRVH